jgi:hypothetical protein
MHECTSWVCSTFSVPTWVDTPSTVQSIAVAVDHFIIIEFAYSVLHHTTPPAHCCLCIVMYTALHSFAPAGARSRQQRQQAGSPQGAAPGTNTLLPLHTSHHITCQCISSHHTTSQHITSHHMHYISLHCFAPAGARSRQQRQQAGSSQGAAPGTKTLLSLHTSHHITCQCSSSHHTKSQYITLHYMH